jgi:hypothetical protein
MPAELPILIYQPLSQKLLEPKLLVCNTLNGINTLHLSLPFFAIVSNAVFQLIPATEGDFIYFSRSANEQKSSGLVIRTSSRHLWRCSALSPLSQRCKGVHPF